MGGSWREDADGSRDSDILQILRGGLVDIELSPGRSQVETGFWVHTFRRHPAANASRDAGLPECSERVVECSRSVVDSCAVTRCNWGLTWRCPMTIEHIWNPSAGTITLSGGDFSPLVIPPPGRDAATINISSEHWKTGQEVEVSATGEMVPAFTGRVKVPAAVDLMTTVMATSAGVTRTDPIKLSWIPNAEGMIEFGVRMSDLPPDAEHTLARAVCTAPATAGMMQIPALRSLLGAASGYTEASMHVRRYQQALVQAGDFAVQITVQVGPTLNFRTPVR